MLTVSLIELVMGFSGAVDLINMKMSNHHKRVAYISYCIALELNISEKDIAQMIYASLLHDCGAIDKLEKINDFDIELSENPFEKHSHGYIGWNMFKQYEEIKDAAEMIKFHHIYWDERNADYFRNYKIPYCSYIIHLADRVESLIRSDIEILSQVPFICHTIAENSGKSFNPEIVRTFEKLAIKESFWFNIVRPDIETTIREIMKNNDIKLDLKQLVLFTKVIYTIIDFRSKFTATHSVGVAECAKFLAKQLEFSKDDIKIIYVSGLLHDIGKLAVPISIIDKADKLSDDELFIIKKHTYDAYQIFNKIKGMEKICKWTAYHHERLDGSGYPFKLKEHELDKGSRIMAISDVFTALTENRPYRQAMSTSEAITIMEEMVKKNLLDDTIFKVLKKNYEEIIKCMSEAQNKASYKLNEFFNNIQYFT